MLGNNVEKEFYGSETIKKKNTIFLEGWKGQKTAALHFYAARPCEQLTFTNRKITGDDASDREEGMGLITWKRNKILDLLRFLFSVSDRF